MHSTAAVGLIAAAYVLRGFVEVQHKIKFRGTFSDDFHLERMPYDRQILRVQVWPLAGPGILVQSWYVQHFQYLDQSECPKPIERWPKLRGLVDHASRTKHTDLVLNPRTALNR